MLVVASASNPMLASNRAVPISHGLGIRKALSRSWSARNRRPFSACVNIAVSLLFPSWQPFVVSVNQPQPRIYRILRETTRASKTKSGVKSRTVPPCPSFLSQRSLMPFHLPVASRRSFLGGSAAPPLAGALPGFAIPAATPRRIILDTDPGVDDAMAIFLALRSPELKVEAITPVSGNVPLSLTLPNALRLVEIANLPDVPVAAGAATPLVRRLVTAKYVHGSNGLAGVDFPEPKLQPVSETAVELIRRIVRKNPGEITIVAVGPLTNIATLLKSDDSIATLIPAIVVMGGSLSGGNITPAAEFNFYVDPEAARIVFDSNIPLTMVGLDVTRKCLVSEQHIK